ncbi:MAG: c-type cytochrome [Pseudomonadota bacterium]
MRFMMGVALAAAAAMAAAPAAWAEDVDHVAAATALIGDMTAEDATKAGKKVFRKCKQCHEVEKDRNKIGPHLVGVFGRTAGTLESFTKYSDPMKAAGTDNPATEEAGDPLVWNVETLTPYLAKPRDYIKGTRMNFAGLKKPEDINVLLYYMAVSGGVPATN